MFAFPCQGSWFDASGADVDPAGGYRIQECHVEPRQRTRGRPGHHPGEAEQPSGGIDGAYPGGFAAAAACRIGHHQPDKLIGQDMRCKLLADVLDGLGILEFCRILGTPYNGGEISDSKERASKADRVFVKRPSCQRRPKNVKETNRPWRTSS